MERSRIVSEEVGILIDEVKEVSQKHEAFGNYVPTVLPNRYDAFLYLDKTQALHPLHIKPEKLEPPDTYPWGI